MNQVAKVTDVTDHTCAVSDCQDLATYGIKTPNDIFLYCQTHIALGRTRHYYPLGNIKLVPTT